MGVKCVMTMQCLGGRRVMAGNLFVLEALASESRAGKFTATAR